MRTFLLKRSGSISTLPTGVGISQDRIDSLFEAFTQADTSTTRKYGGTGLGLSISRQLAELMGGEIGVESVEDEGSTFWYTAVFEKQPVGRHEITEIPADISDKRILVVDDNETNRLMMEKLLISWGCRHDEAADGNTALKKLREAEAENDPFDVAILDMHMPGMDGETLGRAIKEDESLRDIALVMMTSLGLRGDAARLQEIGFAAYLTKPVKQSQVYNCLVAVAREKLAGVGSGATRTQAKPSADKHIITRHTIAEGKRRRIRILLAEDNRTNQIVALKILEKLGYRADAVANGAEAVAALENIPYDLVLMDVQMPEMDGFEATKRIRDPESAVRNHAIPIIAMTAHAMAGDRERCLEAGMDDYVTKPVSARTLMAAIDRQASDKAHIEHDQKPVANPVRPQETVFDKAALLERVDGDEDLLHQILDVFLDDVPSQIQSIVEALAEKDAATIYRCAHLLKGASGSAGAVVMQHIAFELREAGKAEDLIAANQLVQDIEKAFAEFKRVIAGQKCI